MNCLTKLKTWYRERKFTKDRNILFDNCLKEHEEHFLSRIKNNGMDIHNFHKENLLSINFGRQFGTTSYIKYRMSKDPNSILFFEKEKYTENGLTRSLLRTYKKTLRAFNVGSNTKGVTFPNKEFKTILVDRASFHKSNERIIAALFEHYSLLLNTKFRIVILG